MPRPAYRLNTNTPIPLRSISEPCCTSKEHDSDYHYERRVGQPSNELHSHIAHRRGSTLLYCVGHTLGMPWTPSVKPQDIAVLEAMKANHFEVADSTRN